MEINIYNYEKEIDQRNMIIARARNGEKITAEERLWLQTHRKFNTKLGYPYLNTDIIELLPGVLYCIRIKVESCAYKGRILPVVTVPGGKGKIIANEVTKKQKGSSPKNKSIKMLGVLVDLNNDESIFYYQSDLGLLEISFECEYFDSRQCLTIRKNSNLGDPNYSMLGEVLASNKVVYRCKAPTEDNYEGLIFSIEWNTITKM